MTTPPTVTGLEGNSPSRDPSHSAGGGGPQEAPSEIWHVKRGYSADVLYFGREATATAKTITVHEWFCGSLSATPRRWLRTDILASFGSYDDVAAAIESARRAYQSGNSAVRGAERQLADAKRRRDERFLAALGRSASDDHQTPDGATRSEAQRRDIPQSPSPKD